ncbi:hypothetical protein LIER_14068 [Lithospermum erythrorhizon]|uniref:RRM domain-containing protein n=1 Tax=Lithospermum erythrorhizon TaxID=34254 RepID=A0AAV3PXU9_LITER
MNGGDSNQQQQHHQWLAMQQQQYQQWVAMQQYQQQMMYNHHYMPYYHPQHHQQLQQQQMYNQTKQQVQGSDEENRTLWIGDLQQWMDESYLRGCFDNAGEILTVKIIRNRQTFQSERYGFIEFSSHATAEKVLQGYNGTTMPDTDQNFRLNWASFSTGDRRVDSSYDLSIFVGDLAPDVTDALLLETFASKYPSVKGAKVVVDTNTGRSKGYGFVRFSDENEKSRAVTEMNGVLCSNRAMRVGVATPKKPMTQQQFGSQAVILSGRYVPNGALPQGAQSDGDLSNTTIFVGGLDTVVTDEELRQSFIEFGEIISVKIPAGKGCGFVQFADRSNAEDAIEKLNGTVIGKQTVRLSWGRTPGNKQWNGAYYGRQGHGGYSHNQNPSMFPAAASNGAQSNGYGSYQQTVS